MRKVEIIKPNKDFLPKRTKVAAYCRVSTDGEMNEHSFSAQVDFYTNLIGKNPKWENAGIFADFGLTGTNTKRPAFQNLLKACNNGNVELILVKSISRFCRNTVDLLQTIRHLKELNINVKFEKENIESLSSDGELMLSLLASFAQEESRSISENTRWAIKKRFEKGIPNAFVIYGYKWDGENFNIVPEQAETVRFIFDSYLQGKSPNKIAKDLQKQNVLTVLGNKFTYSNVWDILRQEKYTGNSLLQKTYCKDFLTHKYITNKGQAPRYYAEGTHPTIVSKQTFDAVQKEIERRASLGILAKTSVNFSCFTQKIICSKCGHTYRRRVLNKAQGRKYYRWICGNKLENSISACNADNIPETVLYELTSEVLGIENFTKDDFNNVIDNITAEENFNITFHLKDGSTQKKQWQSKTSNKEYWRKINGKKCNNNTRNTK